jgi:hypothetical protein
MRMAGRDNRRLTKEQVQALLTQLEEQVGRPECWSCECLQGFIAQLELDAADDAKPLLARYKKVHGEVQPCRGCEPCPPAEIFAAYLIHKREKNT